jgi:hypothetical protein
VQQALLLLNRDGVFVLSFFQTGSALRSRSKLTGSVVW